MFLKITSNNWNNLNPYCINWNLYSKLLNRETTFMAKVNPQRVFKITYSGSLSQRNYFPFFLTTKAVVGDWSEKNRRQASSQWEYLCWLERHYLGGQVTIKRRVWILDFVKLCYAAVLDREQCDTEKCVTWSHILLVVWCCLFSGRDIIDKLWYTIWSKCLDKPQI